MSTTSQPRFTLLVANFSRPTPSMITGSNPFTAGPTKIRSGFVFGHLQELGFAMDLVPTQAARSLVVRTTNVAIDPFENNPPTRPTGIVTVANNTFAPGSVVLRVGPYELVPYRDWTPGGGAALTATAIAAAINNIANGYSAVPAGPAVTVSGPLGAAPATLALSAQYRTATANFTFAYQGTPGYLGYTDSPLEIGILPPASIGYVAP